MRSIRLVPGGVARAQQEQQEQTQQESPTATPHMRTADLTFIFCMAGAAIDFCH